MLAVVLYTMLSAALFYLGSRAIVTRALWSRYPQSFAHFMDCAACTGFWYGLACSLVIGRHYELSYLGLDAREWHTHILVGLCSIVLTPIAAALQQWGLEFLGSFEIEEPEEPK